LAVRYTQIRKPAGEACLLSAVGSPCSDPVQDLGVSEYVYTFASQQADLPS
jgi:hypothetical protein